MFKRFLFLTLMMLATCICEIAYASGIMISGAMDVETEYMINALQNRQEHRLGVWRFVTGEYQGCPMIISVTSVSQANAAASTALGIEKFQPVAIINQGTAGAHAPEIHPFDIVIGTSACDFGAYKTDSKGNPTFRGVKVYDESSGDFIRVVDFQPDSQLLEIARKLAPTYKFGNVVEGKICTSGAWNKQKSRIKYFHKNFDTMCEEMETATVAQICYDYKIPFIGIRVISNNELTNEDFNPDTGEKCQQFALDVAKAYYESRNQ